MPLLSLRRQPFKGLFLTAQTIATLFMRLPYWCIRYSRVSWRPRESWSFSRAVVVQLTRELSVWPQITGIFWTFPDYREIEGDQAVWVAPVTNERIPTILWDWMTLANIGAVRIPGYWMHRSGSDFTLGQAPIPGEKIIYHCHGGGYTIGSAHSSDPLATISRSLLSHPVSPNVHRTFNIEYRLSTMGADPPRNPFPAALLDALAGYIYLVETVRFSPDDIIIEGDSAGGNLALALVRLLVEYRHKLPPPPSAMVLLSPWSDLSYSHSAPGSSAVLSPDFMDYSNPSKSLHNSILAFVGPHGLAAAESNEYISPASRYLDSKPSFIGFPRMFIAAGGAEAFYDQIVTLAERISVDMGEVCLHEERDAVHDWVVMGAISEPERTSTLDAIAAWLLKTQ